MPVHELSIAIPTLNERDNIRPLVERVDETLRGHNVTYELIFVDDRSTDGTQLQIEELRADYPIRLYEKAGTQGKAQSLVEAFGHARYDLLAMIDADLQYPPEAIPAMLDVVDQGADVVVANRVEAEVSWRRRATSYAFRAVFGRLLHSFGCDVQSGLKLFRTSIARRISVTSKSWSFDLEFLTKARDAGYSIAAVDVPFSGREAGESKVDLVKTSAELASEAVKLKFKQPEPVPFLPQRAKVEGPGFHFKGKKCAPYTSLSAEESALYQLSGYQKLGIGAFLILFAAGLLLNWHAAITAVLALLTVLYFCDLLFNFFLIYRSFAKAPEIRIGEKEIARAPHGGWPLYTILCPLYQEWKILPQFVSAISRIDYPKDKLQVLLLLEENDTATLQAARQAALPDYFEVVVVPASYPKTKPKACNYGLRHARGKFAVIYDAEDVPDPRQLKKVVAAFGKAGRRVACMQAKLNFYNPRQNLLTRLFTAEYSLWFDLVLTGLQSIHAPIPLGGTSNHFRTSDLRRLQGWDPFNVTEDCDLGVRLAKRGFRTALVDSTTLEEANSDLANWFWQRTRWIKGYIQTYLVHMRRPASFLRHPKEGHLATFQLVVGGKVLSMFVNPAMWIITILYFGWRSVAGPAIESVFPAPILYMGVFSAVFGNFLYLYYYMMGCAKRGHDDLIKYVVFAPAYWLAMSVAAWVALVKLMYQPHHWAKTNHGLYFEDAGAVEQARRSIGGDLVDGRVVA